MPGLEASGTGGLLVDVVGGGTDEDLWSAAPFVAAPVCICPLVEASLLVKLEMAQPAQPAPELSFEGVPIRGDVAVDPPGVNAGGGSAVSGIEAANLRMRPM